MLFSTKLILILLVVFLTVKNIAVITFSPGTPLENRYILKISYRRKTKKSWLVHWICLEKLSRMALVRSRLSSPPADRSERRKRTLSRVLSVRTRNVASCITTNFRVRVRLTLHPPSLSALPRFSWNTPPSERFPLKTEGYATKNMETPFFLKSVDNYSVQTVFSPKQGRIQVLLPLDFGYAPVDSQFQVAMLFWTVLILLVLVVSLTVEKIAAITFSLGTPLEINFQ